MHKQKRSNDEKDWKQFSRKWQRFRMQFSTEVDVKFSCDYSYRCFNGLGYSICQFLLLTLILPPAVLLSAQHHKLPGSSE
jgi:hypothetical protein